MVNWSSTKLTRTNNGKRTVPSINGVEKTGYSNAEKWNWAIISPQIQKSTQNGLKT
jgi:hypothetical protein